MSTDLSWLTGYRETAVFGLIAGDDDYLFWGELPGEVARISWVDVPGRAGRALAVNGTVEERDDFPALLGAVDELEAAGVPHETAVYMLAS